MHILHIMFFFAQFVIVGIATEGPAYKKLQDGEMRLLDVITHVNDQEVKYLEKPFDEMMEWKTTVSLKMDHSIFSIVCSKTFFSNCEWLASSCSVYYIVSHIYTVTVVYTIPCFSCSEEISTSCDTHSGTKEPICSW